MKTDGVKCGSPALSGRKFCYYHTLYRQRNKPNKKTSRALRAPMVDADEHWHFIDVMDPFTKRYTLGPIEDGPSIQVAISTVLNALADQRIDPQRASTLLYGLQLASTNLRAIANATRSEPAATPEAPGSHSTTGTYAQVPPAEELSPVPQAEVLSTEELTKTP